MQPAIVNIALPLVKKEIDSILATYPYYPYQKAFAEPELQLKLLAYVLNRVLGIYVVVDHELQAQTAYPAASNRMIEIETTIHSGIKYLVAANKAYDSLPHYFS